MTEHNEQENERKAESWNKCIAPRLESLLGWFNQNEWNLGVSAYLEHARQSLQRQLNNGCDTTRKEDIIRGRLLAIQEFLELPEVIKSHIDKANKKDSRPKPRGDAGY